MSLVTGKKIDSSFVNTIGIRKITAEDVTYAAAIGYTIKLIGCGYTKDGKVNASVEPMLVPESCPLAGIEDVFNGVMVNGNMVDSLLFYGRGAGKLPTASAVMGDVIDIVRNPGYNDYFSWGESDKDSFIPYKDVTARFFVRVNDESRAKVKDVFGDTEIIKGVSDYGFVTPLMTVAQLEESILKIGGAVSTMRLFR